MLSNTGHVSRMVEVHERAAAPSSCLPTTTTTTRPCSLQVREQAAEGLGELVEVTGEEALKPFVVQITGPLIRIIGDRFPSQVWGLGKGAARGQGEGRSNGALICSGGAMAPPALLTVLPCYPLSPPLPHPQVKAAILLTLGLLIRKAGAGLKPFVPQLQTTFLKCLTDASEVVRERAAKDLGELSRMSARVDQLAADLASSARAAEPLVRIGLEGRGQRKGKEGMGGEL